MTRYCYRNENTVITRQFAQANTEFFPCFASGKTHGFPMFCNGEKNLRFLERRRNLM